MEDADVFEQELAALALLLAVRQPQGQVMQLEVVRHINVGPVGRVPEKPCEVVLLR